MDGRIGIGAAFAFTPFAQVERFATPGLVLDVNADASVVLACIGDGLGDC